MFLTKERIDTGVAYYRRVTGDRLPVDIKTVDRPLADADQDAQAYINTVTGEIHLVNNRADAESLMHELVHLWQIRRGSLKAVPVGLDKARAFFDGEEVTKYPYWNRPDEQEARKLGIAWAGRISWPRVLTLNCYGDDVEEVPAFAPAPEVDFSRYANA